MIKLQSQHHLPKVVLITPQITDQ